MVSSQADESLLGAIRTHKGVDLEGVSTEHLLDSLLDLTLVSGHVNLKNEGVLCLNLLGGNLRVDILDDNLVLIHAREFGDRLAEDLGLTAMFKGLWEAEGGAGTHLLGLVAVRALSDSLLSGESLLLICGSHLVASRTVGASVSRCQCKSGLVPYN